MGRHKSRHPERTRLIIRTDEDLIAGAIRFLQSNKGILFKQKNISKEIGVASSRYVHFKQMLKNLVEEGKIESPRNGWFRIPDETRLSEGIISFSRRGFAFVKTTANEEIFIGAGKSANALHLDRVLIERFKHSGGLRPEGQVLKVLTRGQKTMLGILKRQSGRWLVTPEYPAAVTEIQLREIKSGLREGQLVEIENIEWENARQTPQADLKQIIGFPEAPEDDMKIVMKMYRLSEHFPLKVLKEADQIGAGGLESGARLDLRDWEIFTIDPPDAKDFDDAVSLAKLPDGNWRLGVHIADVSHYVTAGSALDREARRRGTSVYLGESVVPMLPERISNELCSLKPAEDRLTFSALITLDRDGQVGEYSFHPASSARLDASVMRRFRRFLTDGTERIRLPWKICAS
jgi:ribonuclease R